MIAKSVKEAWNIVSQIFPTDYEKDEASSQNAGYPIYRSTSDGRYYDYICDLGCGLEINLADGNRSIQIAIREEKDDNTKELIASYKFGMELIKEIETDGQAVSETIYKKMLNLACQIIEKES